MKIFVLLTVFLCAACSGRREEDIITREVPRFVEVLSLPGLKTVNSIYLVNAKLFEPANGETAETIVAEGEGIVAFSIYSNKVRIPLYIYRGEDGGNSGIGDMPEWTGTGAYYVRIMISEYNGSSVESITEYQTNSAVEFDIITTRINYDTIKFKKIEKNNNVTNN